MKLFIGAHTSAQGGVHHALLEGQSIGATTIQLFTANQKTWHTKPISDEEVARWEEALEQTGLQKIMSHDSYLINLGSPSPESQEKSIQAFKNEIQRCHQLKLDFLNFHPGAALDSSEDQCLKQIVESISQVEEMAAQGPTRLLIEATAGQGSSVGHKFEHLGYLVEHLHKKVPIGVCIDTCHIFAAGYDIRTKEGWEQTLKEFDRSVGLKYLYALHLNDSKNPLGSRKDRHAPLGEGEIGIEGFAAIMQNDHLKHLPMYLETPDGVELWKKEIALLRKLAE